MDACPMNGGLGPYSYSSNSSPQKSVMDSLKELIKKAIIENFDIKNDSSSRILRIADLGCSVGPNTFHAMQNIVDAVNSKCQILGLDSHTIEFNVFFNDLVSNDFNTLFTSLPLQRQYYAAGVPGSFQQRLFPKGSLHIVHSALSMHWLSKVPEQVLDRSSAAWNKGRIHYCNAPDAVINAFAAQFEEDMNRFLISRAEEVVQGGLMPLTLFVRANGSLHSQSVHNVILEILGFCIFELVQKGTIDEEKANTFNIPIYVATANDFMEVVDKNGCFSIEERKEFCLDEVCPPMSPEKTCLTFRALSENAVKAHFGESIVNEIYSSFLEKLEEKIPTIQTHYSLVLFLLLMRK